MTIKIHAAERIRASSIVNLLTHVKAVVTDTNPIDCPASWILMNAPRPLVGDKLGNGEFLTGRFYAAINPDLDSAEAHIKQNIKLDGAVVIVCTDKEADAMARQLVPQQYRSKLDAMDEGKQKQLLKQYRSKLHGMPYGEMLRLK